MISLSLYRTKTEKTAKSTDEAIELALSELRISKEEAIIDITDEGSKGFLGIGSKGASVSVTAKDPYSVIAKNFLSDIFAAMGIDADVNAKTTDDVLNAEVSGEHMGLVIGKRGDTLDSLQYLTSLVVNKDSDERIRVILDTENYRSKRQDALIALASRLAKKVASTGKKHTLEPMNPYERRIIHSSLQSNDDVTTYSIGEEPYRRLVIAPKNQKSNDREYPHTPSTPHISSHIASEYRQQNHNKVKSYDEFLAAENAAEEE